MRSGVKDLGLSFGSRIITSISALGVQLVLAWFLGTAGRGSYAVCLLFSGLLSVVFFMGCQMAGIYFVSSRRFSLSEGIVYTLIYGGFGSLLAILAGLVLMRLPIAFFDKADRPELYLALASIPGFLFFTVFSHLFTAIRQFGWYSAATLLRGFGLLLFTPLLLRFFYSGPPGAITAIIVTDLLVVAFCLVVFRWKFGLKPVAVRMKNLLAMFHYGVRYWIGVISNQMNFRICTLVLAFFVARDEIGIYALAVGLTLKMQMLPDALKMALIPRSSCEKDGRRELVASCARLTGLVSFLLLAAFILLARPLIALFFPEAFSPAVPLIRILAVGFFIRTWGKSLEPYLIGRDRPGLVSLSVTVGMAVNVGSLVFLLPRFGLAGAAWSVVLNYLVSSAILTYNFRRFSELDWRSIWKPKTGDFSFLAGLTTCLYPGKTLNKGDTGRQ